jgi:long-chain fatty acid transport protein
MSIRCSWLAAAGIVLATTTAAEASPQEVLGFGFRSMGMGTTGAAVGTGVDTVYANPALLSAERDLGLQIGLVGASFGLDVEGAGLPPLPSYPSFRAITIGGVLPLPFGGVLKDRVALGLGFVTPLEIVVRGRILYPETPQYLIADRVQAVAVQAALGVDIGYGIRIGGGFAASAALTGSVLVAEDASGRIGTNVEDTLVATYAPLVGASYDIGDSYRVGLAFRGELDGRLDVVITAEDLGELQIPPLNIGGVAQYDPWQIAAELARVKGDLRLALGVTYKHWAAYPGAAEATVRCEEGSRCLALVPEDPEYIPTVAPRAGVEYRIPIEPVTLALRGGYAFEPSPAPEQVGRTNSFDNHRSIFTLGYGVEVVEPIGLSLDGMIGLHVLHARSHEKSVAAGAAADGTVETSGAVLAGGTAITVKF